MIIDCHVHIMTSGDEELSNLLRCADRNQIDQLCIASLSRTWSPRPSEEQLEEAAADVLEACRRFPDRFVGFTYVSADHIEKSLELIERCNVEGPCRFVKLWISQFMDDPRLTPIYERVRELRQAVMAHTWCKATGNLEYESTFEHATRIAAQYPDLRLWIAHCSGRWEEVGRAISPYPNLCVDLSGGEPEAGIVETLLNDLPAERIFFGSDAPGRNMAVQMSKVLSAGLPPELERKILGENIAKWIEARPPK